MWVSVLTSSRVQISKSSTYIFLPLAAFFSHFSKGHYHFLSLSYDIRQLVLAKEFNLWFSNWYHLMLEKPVSFQVIKTCQSWGAIWDVGIPRVRVQHGIVQCALNLREREHKNKLNSGNSKSHSETSVTILVHSPAALMWLNRLANLSAIVLFSFSLPPSRCSAWLLWGSRWSTGAAIIIQHSQGRTRAQCQSDCQPVVGKVTRRALYWIPAEAEERCPRDPEATAGQWLKADSAYEKSLLHTEPSKGGQNLKTRIFIHLPYTRTPLNHLLLLTYSQLTGNKIYFFCQQSPGVTISS